MSATAQTAPAQGILPFLGRAFTSSLGAKVVMALTGLVLVGFLVGHLAGNLLVFGGPDAMNQYAYLLKNSPPLLWGTRIVVAVALVLHVWSGLRLAALNRAARPQAYARKDWRKASFASRSMAVSGLVVLVFFVFHIAHFTLGFVYPEYFAQMDPKVRDRQDVFAMMVLGFREWWVALFYIVSVALVGLHLSHGVWSAFQSLSVHGRKWTPFLTRLGMGLAVVLAVGFITIPVAILFFGFGSEYVGPILERTGR